jgi:LuxR family maltose regulon positive regulatory protein
VWLSCDEGDNDPAVLLTYLTAALGRLVPAARSAFQALATSTMPIIVVHQLTAAIRSITPGVSVVVDHAEAITNVESRRVLAEFALRLPAGSRLAIGSRESVPLPVGRLRARGEIVEIGPDDLAMDPTEASRMIAGTGVTLSPTEVMELVERTEGWPVGLYLAARSTRSGTSRHHAGLTAAHDESFIAGYVRSELLDRVSSDEVSFLIRTSVLDRMSGPLCDATLAVSGSARALEQLASRSLMIVPLDHHQEWYRYHHLLRSELRAELERREPDVIQGLDLRASEWFHAHGIPEAAIEHAQAVGDADRVARLVVEAAQPVWASGRVDTVLRWMEWLDAKQAVERYPEIAVHGALTLALLGRAEEAERWVAVAECGKTSGEFSDGSTVESILAYMRAILCRDGIEAMRRDARASWTGLSPVSPYRATMVYTEGVSYLLQDDPDQADPILANAFDDAVRASALPLAALILAERCCAAVDGNDWAAAGSLVQRALSIVHEGHFEDYWTSALIYAWAARAALHRGDLHGARRCLAAAARLRPLLTHVLPVVSVQALVQMARVYLALADPGGARAVLTQAEHIRSRRPDLGNMWSQADRLRSNLQRIGRISQGATSLTAAELRVLPLLSTHLSLGEIGQQLRVSPNTVKAHAKSIYRKLGVSSRAAAVAGARELDL